MKLLFFFSLIILTFSTSAIGNSNFSNEPQGLTPILDCPFTSGLCAPMYNAYNTFDQETLPGFGAVSPPYAMVQKMSKNSQYGNGEWGMFFPPAKSVFLAAIWATNSDFQGYSNNTNKLIFIRNHSAGSNSFLVWQGSPGGIKTIKWAQQSVVDNCHVPEFQPGASANFCWNATGPTHDGTGWFEPNESGAGSLNAGTGYHKLEVFLQASTTKSSKDGILRIWVDGQRTHNYTNANFAEIDQGGFNEFDITAAWDGSGSCSTRDCSKEWIHYFDHIYVSTSNGGGVINSTPPASLNKPTNLRIL